MNNLNQYEVWFVTGSQHLYGEETLLQVADNAKEIARALNHSSELPVSIFPMNLLFVTLSVMT